MPSALEKKDTAMQTLQIPDEVAEDFKKSLSDKLKNKIITENGLTIAQEEEILNLDPDDTVGAMSPQEAIAYLKSLRTQNEN